jgi:hypothetical protein
VYKRFVEGTLLQFPGRGVHTTEFLAERGERVLGDGNEHEAVAAIDEFEAMAELLPKMFREVDTAVFGVDIHKTVQWAKFPVAF